jgi:hypothetical protein
MEAHVLLPVQKFHDFEPGQIHSRAAADRNLVSGFGLAFKPGSVEWLINGKET